MTGHAHPPATCKTTTSALADARKVRDRPAFATEAADRTGNRLETALEDPLARHRRLHRPGVPSRIDADPASRSFGIERIAWMTINERHLGIAAA